MKTGRVVDELALYSTECCHAELIFDFGDVFTLCPRCLHGCEWKIEERLLTTAELERVDPIAA